MDNKWLECREPIRKFKKCFIFGKVKPNSFSGRLFLLFWSSILFLVISDNQMTANMDPGVIIVQYYFQPDSRLHKSFVYNQSIYVSVINVTFSLGAYWKGTLRIGVLICWKKWLLVGIAYSKGDTFRKVVLIKGNHCQW